MSDLYDTDFALTGPSNRPACCAVMPPQAGEQRRSRLAQYRRGDRELGQKRPARDPQPPRRDLPAPAEVGFPAGGKGGGWRGPGGAFPGYPLSRGHQVVASRDAARIA